MSGAYSPGTRIGHFQLDQPVGSGAFASVWRAHPLRSPQTPVAIKIIRKATICTPIAKTRLTREISLLRKLRHPFIAEFFELIDDSDLGSYCLVMEHIDHGNLLEYVNTHGRLGEDQARCYFTQLLWVLEYLHLQMHVAHRDLKCENVLLDSHNNIRVIDFGLSYQFPESHPELTTACGSPAYAAPEMVKGNTYTRATDIWSTGIMLFAIVAGHLPFDDSNVQRLLQRVVTTEPIYPTYMSPPLIDLLQKMLIKDPDYRITLEQIRAHPWFSQNEYNVMLQLSRAEVKHWETAEGVTEEAAIDREVILVMQGLGIDCTGLEQIILTQVTAESHELLVLYRIFKRQKLANGMKDLMHRVAQGAVANAKPVAGRVACTRIPALGGGGGPMLPPLAGFPAGAAMPLGGARIRPLGTPAGLGTSGRRLSRPVAMRRPVESFTGPQVGAHETP
jgi:hypothetical protein